MVSDETDALVSTRQQVRRGQPPPATLSITTRGSRGCRASTSTAGRPSRSSASTSASLTGERDDQQPGDTIPVRQVAQHALALLGRLDVVEHQVVLAALPRPSRSTTPRRRSITEGAVKNGTTTPTAIARPIERLRAVALRR